MADGSFGNFEIRHTFPDAAHWPASGEPFARGPFPLYRDATEEGDVVGFAGAGGVDQAVEEWLGPGHAALNHWSLAISVNKRNFPKSEHWCADIWDTDPALPLAGKRIRLLWVSPDCRHFSPAKGSAPVSDSIRALAWVVLPWIIKRRPRVIMLENVPAFMTWGPTMINDKGQTVPNPKFKSRTFWRYVNKIRKAGYTVEFVAKSDSADFGEAQRRVRFIMIMRCDGLPIAWPEATHGPAETAVARGLEPFVPASTIIDFNRPVYSIFMTRDEAKALGVRVKRPLEEATFRRIALGLFKRVIECADPFVIELTHRGEADRSHGVSGRLPVITGAHRGELALCEPYCVPITQTKWAAERSIDLRRGLPVVTGAKGGEFALCAPIIDVAYGRSVPASAAEPMGSPTGRPHHGLVAAFMEQANTGQQGRDMRNPLSAVLGSGSHQQPVLAYLSQLRSSNEGGGGDLVQSLPAVTAQGGHLALIESLLDRDLDMAKPFAREGEMRAFLTKYFGTATTEDLANPLSTTTSRARLGLVVVHGVAYRIVDIGMRMLDPETELAAAMGVREGFVLREDAYGNRISKTNITKMVGNMVCRRWALAHIAANFPKVAVAEAVAA